MTDSVEILESCDIVHEGEQAPPGRYTVRIVDGHPSTLTAPDGQEGPVTITSFPLPQTADKNVALLGVHILVERPDLAGFVAVDESGAIQGVIPAESLRRLIVRALETPETDAWKEISNGLGVEEEVASEVMTSLSSLRGVLGYQPLTGTGRSSVTIYVCPTDDCDTAPFVPYQDGVPIPECLKHHRSLEPKKLGG